MGLIKAGIGAIGGTFADQWKEFFYCEALNKEVLVAKGVKRITDRSTNKKGNDFYYCYFCFPESIYFNFMKLRK